MLKSTVRSLCSGLFFGALVLHALAAAAHAEAQNSIVSLDGTWRIATDPQNIGKEQGWFKTPNADALDTNVPWIIQDPFPGYHGVAWYWRSFEAPQNAYADGRYLLRFWAVDYKADVWLNDTYLGSHEGGEEPFSFDVTGIVRAGNDNRVAVRVLNPKDEPIDDIILAQTPHRNKVNKYFAGASYNLGGITDSVELVMTPQVRIDDFYVHANWKTGEVNIQTTFFNAGKDSQTGTLTLSIAPAANGTTLEAATINVTAGPGTSVVNSTLKVSQPHLWDVKDPYLYRVTARLNTKGGECEQSTRCGFRDFRFENGHFRLNGKALFLKGSHTGNHWPIGQQLPYDPDWARRDLINVKMMGFNSIRFIAGVPMRLQLDYCDEIGLLVYEESYAAWCTENSPHFAQRYDSSVLGMIKRDRNHPCIVIWGLLNETPVGPVHQQAVEFLPKLRALDETRAVLLSSGRWDVTAGGEPVGIHIHRIQGQFDPSATHNGTDAPISALGITWQPGQFALHPGPKGEYSVARWTAPQDGKCDITAVYSSIAEKATTDVHVLHNGKPLFDGFVNVGDAGKETKYSGSVDIKKGDLIDFALSFGNGDYGADTTALAATIAYANGPSFDVAKDYLAKGSPWTYGYLPRTDVPDSSAFIAYDEAKTIGEGSRLGSISNPGSHEWEDILDDQHIYPHVPHSPEIVATLRNYRGVGNPVGFGDGGLANIENRPALRPVFISEYGIGSAVDLVRTTRWFEQLGKANLDDAVFYKGLLDRFMNDWTAWRLDETFASPEDYFAQTIKKMAAQRTLGFNAFRSNPNCAGLSVTGTVDQGNTGEGLTATTFRELKPGATDAAFDGWAPVRWCLFVGPEHLYRNGNVRLEAVVANEDTLAPGDYSARLQVVGPRGIRVFDRSITVTIPKTEPGQPEVFAVPVFDEEVPIDGPTGEYRFLAAFQQGAAAAGGDVRFFIDDPADMPAIESEVVLWGSDERVEKWLPTQNIKCRAFDPARKDVRETILALRTPPAPGGAEAFTELAKRIAQGSNVVFLSPEVFASEKSPVSYLPLANKGQLLSLYSWLYLKDDWAKYHPFFEGMQTGGMLDYSYYVGMLSDSVWQGQDAPAEAVAGAIKASQDYSSGLNLCVYRLGEGRFVLNTMRIAENLGTNPAAERLLRNLIKANAPTENKPLAALPTDFDATLKAFGYK
ncbi:MAG: glycoside hydrolase family 2 [Candidatus Hydrogenedentes bacterium]|nr:glycoside hydrolase family 2 [Candidatus Hydrogenedentota bacterium]